MKTLLFCVLSFALSTETFSSTPVSGPINSNTTWFLAGSPYIVTGDVTVAAGVILTISPGVVVLFDQFNDLIINGALIADGTPTDSIVFSANSVTPSSSYWGGITFNQSTISSQSVMDYCVLKYSGDNYNFNGGEQGPILLDARANPRLTNLTMYNNRWNGIQLVAATYSQHIILDVIDKPYFVRGDMIVAAGYIMTVKPKVVLKFEAFTDLTINGALIADGKVDSLITFTSFKDDSAGTMDSNGDGISFGAANDWGGVIFNQSTLSTQSVVDYCVLKYTGDNFGGNGGEQGPIFLDARANPRLTNLTLYSNRWNSVELLGATYSQHITLDVIDKPYFVRGDIAIAAGYTMAVKPKVILKFDAFVDLTVNGVLVADGKSDSLIIFTSFKDDSAGTMDSNGDGISFGAANDWGGVIFNQSNLSSQSVMDYCVLKYSGDNYNFNGGEQGPILLDARANPHFTNLTMYNNRWNSIELLGISYSQHITLDVIDKPYFVRGDIAIAAGYTMTVKPKVVLKFDAFVDLTVNGALVADGKVDSVITFTSFKDDSAGTMDSNGDGISFGAANDWGGVIFNQSNLSSQSVMDYCIMKYSGDNYNFNGGEQGAILLDARANPRLTNLTMYNNRWNSLQLMATTYSQHITLDVIDKPYFVRGDMIVAAGYIMTVKPKVVLKFEAFTDLTINGALIADGKVDSLITFTSFKDDSAGTMDSNGDGISFGAANDWGGVIFNQSNLSSQSVMDYCVLKYSGDNYSFNGGEQGPVLLDARANPGLTRLILYSNRWNGIDILPATYTSNITLDITSIPYVLRGILTVNPGATLVIQQGVTIKSTSGVVVFVDGALKSLGYFGSPVVLTSITDDAHGGDTNADGPSSGAGNDWGGVYFRNASIDTLCKLSHTELLYGGGSSANGYSLVGITDASPKIEFSILSNSGNSGVRCSGVSSPDFGGGVQASIGYNRFEGFVGSGRYAFYNDGTAAIPAALNCWGTTDSLQINSIIYDRRDNASKGLVTYLPYRSVCDSNIIISSINVTFPNGGETLFRGSPYAIQWEDSNFSNNVQIRLYKGGVPIKLLSGSEIDDGTFSFVPSCDLPNGSDYTMLIADAVAGTVFDFSDDEFTIGASPVGVLGATDPCSGVFRLRFPLRGSRPGERKPLDGAQTHDIISVFDHLQGGNPRVGNPYLVNDSILNYMGEMGLHSVGFCDDGYKSPNGIWFDQTVGNYTGPNGSNCSSPTRRYLFYDGHPGYDYRASLLTEVFPAAPGVVTLFYGGFNTLEIDHQNGYKSRYLHLHSYNIANHATITDVNQPIAFSGDKGAAGRPHLHYELYYSPTPAIPGSFKRVDPYGWGGAISDPYPYPNGASNRNLWEHEVIPYYVKAVRNGTGVKVSWIFDDCASTPSQFAIIRESQSSPQEIVRFNHPVATNSCVGYSFSYSDVTAQPGRTYLYSVKGIFSNGDSTAPSSSNVIYVDPAYQRDQVLYAFSSSTSPFTVSNPGLYHVTLRQPATQVSRFLNARRDTEANVSILSWELVDSSGQRLDNSSLNVGNVYLSDTVQSYVVRFDNNQLGLWNLLITGGEDIPIGDSLPVNTRIDTTNQPAPVVERTPLNFGDVLIGTATTDSVSITNIGSLPLVISWNYQGDNAIAVIADTVTLLPLNSLTVPVSFSPTDTIPYAGNIILLYNAVASPDTVPVYGMGTRTVNGLYQVASGWNIVSVPLATEQYRRLDLYPTSISAAFKFVSGTGYLAQDTLLTGTGYWLKFGAYESVEMTGLPISSDSIPVHQGWNIIGSITNSTDTGSVASSPPGIVLSSYYGYSAGYHAVARIDSGKGYWVKIAANGTLILYGGTASPESNKNVTDRLEEFQTITIRDAAGNSQLLLVGMHDKFGDLVSRFELPPVPPQGAFDARFASGSMLAIAPDGESREFPMLISSAQYPLTVSWDVRFDICTMFLKYGGVKIPMNGNGSITITDEGSSLGLELLGCSKLPIEFSLAQNYPNPFNPSTKIEYQLPVDARVVLSIVNLLGQEVATLVNGNEKAGFKSVNWNAMNVASGVYFCRLRAGDYVATRKMLLLK